MNVPFFMHDLGSAELSGIADVFKGPILTTGDKVSEFELQLAEYLECRSVVTVSSCTAGLHLSLLALGIGPGDEVIAPALTFVATFQSIVYAGATPVVVDVEAETGCIDLKEVERAITPKTKAIMPVHLYGMLVDMVGLRALADRYNLKIIEDAAHCIEGVRNGVRPASLGEIAAFSFFATKNLTCGEGGAIATNDTGLAKKLKLLRSHGMTKTSADRFKEGYQHYDVENMGWKYNMGNIEAAILLAQLPRLKQKLQRRHEIALLYDQKLEALKPFIKMPLSAPNSIHARHLYTIWVESERRDDLVQHMQKNAVGVVVNYRPIHYLTWIQKEFGLKVGDFPASEKIGASTISLPFYPTMPEEHIDRTVEVLKQFFR